VLGIEEIWKNKSQRGAGNILDVPEGCALLRKLDKRSHVSRGTDNNDKKKRLNGRENTRGGGCAIGSEYDKRDKGRQKNKNSFYFSVNGAVKALFGSGKRKSRSFGKGCKSLQFTDWQKRESTGKTSRKNWRCVKIRGGAQRKKRGNRDHQGKKTIFAWFERPSGRREKKN